jgi:ABC-2 type transport system permease protein
MAIAVWIGTAMGSASLSLGDSLIGTLNTLPVVALAMGFAVLVHGVQPRVVVPVVGGAVLVAYLLDLLGPAIDLPDWVVDLSPFSHVAVAPAQAVAWTATAMMCAVAVGAGALGAVAFTRRDLQ